MTITPERLKEIRKYFLCHPAVKELLAALEEMEGENRLAFAALENAVRPDIHEMIKRERDSLRAQLERAEGVITQITQLPTACGKDIARAYLNRKEKP